MAMDLVETIENVETLDKAANPIASAIGRAVPAGPVKDVLSGTQLGHPVHPVLTDVVIGAWTSSLVLDLVGGPSAREASDRLIAVGLAAAAPTAVSGLSDWADTEGKTRRIGLVHAGVNVGANLCYGASLAARRRGARGAGIALSLAGAGVMTLGAYLGRAPVVPQGGRGRRDGLRPRSLRVDAGDGRDGPPARDGDPSHRRGDTAPPLPLRRHDPRHPRPLLAPRWAAPRGRVRR